MDNERIKKFRNITIGFIIGVISSNTSFYFINSKYLSKRTNNYAVYLNEDRFKTFTNIKSIEETDDGLILIDDKNNKKKINYASFIGVSEFKGNVEDAMIKNLISENILQDNNYLYEKLINNGLKVKEKYLNNKKVVSPTGYILVLNNATIKDVFNVGSENVIYINDYNWELDDLTAYVNDEIYYFNKNIIKAIIPLFMMPISYQKDVLNRNVKTMTRKF